MTDDFPTVIRKARIAAEMTQAELAKRLGTSAPYLSSIESGQQPATGAMVKRLERHLGPLEDRAVIVGFKDARPYVFLESTPSWVNREIGGWADRGIRPVCMMLSEARKYLAEHHKERSP